MEEAKSRGDLHVNIARQSSLRQGGSLKSSLSGRSTPRNSPTYRLLHSSRTPRREGRSSGGAVQWFRSNRLVYWLLLITLWAYLAFYVQSRWAHGDNKEEFLGFGVNKRDEHLNTEQSTRRDLLASNSSVAVNNGTNKIQVGDGKGIDVVLAKKGNVVSSNRGKTSRKRSKKAERKLHRKVRDKQKATVQVESDDVDVQEPDIPRNNASYGLLVGPFGSIEDKILEWSPEKRTGTCDRKGHFARLVWSRKFVLVFHELSMTGAPLSMLELATEFLSCGATVSAVVLSKKGGLMSELARRKIKVLEDRADLSFKTAMKADLVIAGSAVCASWLDQYIAHFPAGGSQIAWWIMENRREYFDRSKSILHRVKMLVFLSESQTKQWLTWCEEENIKLRSPPAVVQLSVNDELAFVAGIACSLNTPSSSPEKMLEKRQLLRDTVRKEMGLTDNDMLVMSISSINQGKGQHLLLESVNLMIEQEHLLKIRMSADIDKDQSKLAAKQSDLAAKHHLRTSRVQQTRRTLIRKEQSNLAAKQHLRALLQDFNNAGEFSNELGNFSKSLIRLNEPKKKESKFLGVLKSIDYSNAVNVDTSHGRRKVLSDIEGVQKQALKILIGSVGSKSNKVPYVKEILRFLSEHSNLSKSVLWTSATKRVASLYSAADAYVINSQGMGETFGRVTVEAMAFGLPVLGTDAGGTKEIVENNVTGLLHPVGRPGTGVLAQNLQFLLQNPSVREEMGMAGKKKVERMYLKRHMYKKFADVLYKCMRIK